MIQPNVTRANRLDADAEARLVAECQRGSQVAKAAVVRAMEPFVLKIALEYRRFGLPLEDVAQEGRIGLLKALDRYDPGRGVRLSTYAAYWIRAEIREFVVRGYRMTRIGGSKGDRRALRHYRRTREQRPEVLARAANISTARAEALLPLLVARDVELDAHDGREDGHPLGERLASPAQTPEQLVADQESAEDERRRLQRALDSLPERDREIVVLRYLADSPATLEEVGRLFGISKERVRQLEERAKGRIRLRIGPGDSPLAA